MNTLIAMKQASWIWCDDSTEPNQYAQFLQDFTVECATACLHISADMCYAVFINGHYVPSFAYSDYPDCRSIDTLDVSAFLHPGKNRLCIVGHCPITTSFIYKEGRPGVRFALCSDEQIIAVSGQQTLARRASDYESGKIENITMQLGYTFHSDLTQNDGWLNETYTPDVSWHPAVSALTTADLQLRPIPPLTLQDRHAASIRTYGSFTDAADQTEQPAATRMQYAALTFGGHLVTQKIPRHLPSDNGVVLSCNSGDGLYVIIDLEEETVGLLDIDLELDREATIFIGYGEHLDDLRVRTHVGSRHFAAVYHGGRGRQQFTHYFKRIGGRYLQLHIYAPSVKLYYAGVRPVNYPLTVQPFTTGDMLMDKIYNTSVRTLELCIHEHYEDCPWREQGLYGMDSRLQILCGYYAFSETTMPRTSLELMAKGVREDGMIQLCSPSEFIQTIPSFSLAFIEAVKDYVDFTGDTAFAAKMMPIMNGIVDRFLLQLTSDGLLTDFDGPTYWNFYEWSDGLEINSWPVHSPSGLYAPLQAMFILAAERYLAMCHLTSLQPVRLDLEAIVENMKKMSQCFWNEDRQVFATCPDADVPDSELVQSLMVLAGIATDEQREIVLQKLANPDGSLTEITLSHSIFKYDALMTDPDRYGCFVYNNIADIWGNMLLNGATSFWETQRGAWDFEDAGSLCHGWAAIPVYIYHRYKTVMPKKRETL